MTLAIIDALESPLTLASTEELRKQLAGEPESATDDTTLRDYLEQATALVCSALGRPVLAGLYCETIRVGYGERRLSLPLTVTPLIWIDEVKREGVLLDPGEDGWDVSFSSGLLYPCDCLGAWWYAGLYRVTFRGGWIAPGSKDPDGKDLKSTVPADIRTATLSTARGLYFTAQRGDPLLKSESEQGVGATSWNTHEASSGGLPPDAAAIIARYASAGLA